MRRVTGLDSNRAPGLVIVLGVGCCLLGACTGMPDRVTPVSDFDVARYLGKWYEIARLDHRFEKGLEQVTARYSVRPDGGIKVVNRGFNTARGEWRQAEGRAYFMGDRQTGRLQVSFFGPFYGSYNIIELDRPGYRYALVCGPDTSYLWILARRPDIDPLIVERLVARAGALGFDTSRLIYVKQRP